MAPKSFQTGDQTEKHVSDGRRQVSDWYQSENHFFQTRRWKGLYCSQNVDPDHLTTSTSQKKLHQHSGQNGSVERSTALTGTIFVTISVFVSRGHFRALHKAYTRVQVEAGNPTQGPTQAPYTKVAGILLK